MTPYEILLSESQERMLVVAKRGREDEVTAILEKWDLTAAVIGEVIAEPVYRVTEGDRVVAEFPGIAPRHRLPDVHARGARERRGRRAARARRRPRSPSAPKSAIRAGRSTQLLSSPTIARKTWVHRQYDTTVRTNTVIGPGGDAAVVRVRGTDTRARRARPTATVATSISTRASARRSPSPRRRATSPAPARARWRSRTISISAIRGGPRSTSSCAKRSRGMGEACNALGTPVTGGNVSLYNENPQGAVYPTPVIGMVGLIDSIAHITRSHFQNEGDAIVLLGEPTAELGASEYLARIHGVVAGAPPRVRSRRRARADRRAARGDHAAASSRRRTTAATAASPSRSPSAA